MSLLQYSLVLSYKISLIAFAQIWRNPAGVDRNRKKAKCMNVHYKPECLFLDGPFQPSVMFANKAGSQVLHSRVGL
jgi:hypothetical protein